MQQERHYIVSLIGTSAIHQLEYLFSIAQYLGASDIHFDIQKTSSQITLRVEGRLVCKTYIEIEVARLVIGRLKLISGMRTDIADRGQDGAGSIDISSSLLHFRSATSPTVLGKI